MDEFDNARTSEVDRMREAGYVPAGKVADVLGHSPSTVHRWADAGQINVLRVGGGRQRKRLFIELESLRKLLEGNPVALGLLNEGFS